MLKMQFKKISQTKRMGWFLSLVSLCFMLFSCGEKKVVAPKGPDPVLTFEVHGVKFNMNLVEAGSFHMGDYTYAFARPMHKVTIQDDFYMGETEVTQELWEAVMGSNPSEFQQSVDRPVETVSWNDSQKFIKKLNALTGETFRLPTEEEWEYAARGGKEGKGYEYSGSNVPEDVAWFENPFTMPVASKEPNELGLYDMSGNVWEWVDSYWTKSYEPTAAEQTKHRVQRGGCWFTSAEYSAVWYRLYGTHTGKNEYSGFRIAMNMKK
jgi:formylglycine-generating enzyme required for sulfatase activity